MELTKKALEDVKFRTKGKWYSAEQVDSFIEELTVCVDEAERETNRLREELRETESREEAARREIGRLEEELEALRAAPAPKPEAVPEPAAEPGEHQRRVCEELERERDELIADIKVLRRYRGTFREAVEKDAKELLERVGSLSSERLL